MRVQSRFFAATSGWLLAASVATTGSLLAVSHLARGILDHPSSQLSVSTVNADLAIENSELAHITPPKSVAPMVRTNPKLHRTSGKPPASASPASQRVFTTVGGTVTAQCEAGGAYLDNWVPQQGYAADRWTQGPAAVVGVTFFASSSGVRIEVSCAAGVPVAHVRSLESGDPSGDGPDD